MRVRPIDVLIAMGVAVMHVRLVSSLGTPDRATREAPSSDSIVVTLLAPQGLRTGDVPMPILHLSSPTLTLSTLVNITFEDPDADTVPGVIGASSAPHPIRSEFIEQSAYALRAGLVAGESVTIVLRVEVLPDGSVGEVTVQSSSGNPSADSEAIALVHTQRWTPGTLHRRAITMRVQYSVTLSAPA